MSEEIELKLGLRDPGRVTALLAALPAPVAVTEQRNHYLVDPAGITRAAGVMVRAREERSGEAGALTRVVLTAKRRLSAAGGVFIADEREQTLPRPLWAAFLDGAQGASERLLAASGSATEWLRDELGVTHLLTQGVMANLRRVIPHAGYVLEVDETAFPGGAVEVEIEVETADPEGARVTVRALAEAAGVSLFEQRLGKYARFLAAIGEPIGDG